MLVRIVVNSAARIMRASDKQAARLARMARKHGLSFQCWADWQSNIALAAQAAGYDAEVERDECPEVPADEKRAAESGYRPTQCLTI